jgi:hypothetical protein
MQAGMPFVPVGVTVRGFGMTVRGFGMTVFEGSGRRVARGAIASKPGREEQKWSCMPAPVYHDAESEANPFMCEY